MTSPYADLTRPPLRREALARALVHEPGLWTELRVLDRTGSTNADVLAAARRGAGEGLVVVAEQQDAGRGRLDRAWQSPPRAGLTFSVLLAPGAVPQPRWTWIPLLVGLGVAEAVAAVTGLDVRLKWPNDLLVAGGKLAGVLAERQDRHVVAGVGLNVTTRREELPRPDATSLLLAGAVTTDRDTVLRAALRGLERHFVAWRDANGDAAACGLRAAYASRCSSLGTRLRVTLPSGEVREGLGDSIDPAGRLVLATGAGTLVLGAGDVEHVRPVGAP